MAFKIQNRMLDIPADMPGRYIGRMQCSGCQGWEEQEQGEQDQRQQEQGEHESGPPLMPREHMEECPGFAFLRAGTERLDVREPSEFFSSVMKFRSMRS
jgi:hypothetical protein